MSYLFFMVIYKNIVVEINNGTKYKINHGSAVN
jgi:hypothetical protein